MSIGDQVGAIKAAFIALDHLTRLRQRQRQQEENLTAIAQLLDPNNPTAFLTRIRQLHTANIPAEKAAAYLTDLDTLNKRLGALGVQIEHGAGPQRPAFLGPRIEEPAEDPLPEEVPAEP